MRIMLMGATGGTGREIVREALERGWSINALARSRAKAAALGSGVDLIEGDALDETSVRAAVEGCDGVVNALGPKLSPIREVTLLSRSTHVLIRAMREAATSRLVCVTGMGAGDSRGHGGFFYDRIFQPLLLGPIYRDKDRQEEAVRTSGLDWTIVRPAVLSNRPATGRVRALVDLAGFHGGSISRADVARFLLDTVGSRNWLRAAPLIVGG